MVHRTGTANWAVIMIIGRYDHLTLEICVLYKNYVLGDSPLPYHYFLLTFSIYPTLCGAANWFI